MYETRSACGVHSRGFLTDVALPALRRACPGSGRVNIPVYATTLLMRTGAKLGGSRSRHLADLNENTQATCLHLLPQVQIRNLASMVRDQPFLPTVCPHVWANESISYNHVDPKTLDFPRIFDKIRRTKRARFEFESLQGHSVKVLIRVICCHKLVLFQGMIAHN
jgi:hypothetical protein